MFISRKKLERIIEEERQKERERFWKEQDRQRESEVINRRFNELEDRVWQLSEMVKKKSKKKLKPLTIK